MSLATWKQEFYPVAATEVAKEDALDHSLQKWTGFEQANLDKHGVAIYKNSISLRVSVRDEDESLDVRGQTCSLCIHHLACEECPLVQVRGVDCCTKDETEALSPWDHFTSRRDPGPMLALLRKAKALEGAK